MEIVLDLRVQYKLVALYSLTSLSHTPTLGRKVILSWDFRERKAGGGAN